MRINSATGNLYDLFTPPAFASSVLDKEEIELWMDMLGRVSRLADEARVLQVRLMIDAEQSYFQPAIDNIVLRMQREVREYANT